MSVIMAVAINAFSTLSHRFVSRYLQPIYFSRSIATTTSSVETPQPIRSGKRRVPRLCPVDAYRITPYKLVKLYTDKLKRGHPMLIRNLPGFLDGQTWFDHAANHDGSFKVPQKQPTKPSVPGFALLRDILESAATGRRQRDVTSSPEPVNLRGVFDDLEAECKIARTALEGDYPPLLNFRDWLPRSNFKDYSLEKPIAELQEKFRVNPQQWTPFKAPLGFIHAVHQYNQSQEDKTWAVPWLESGVVHDWDHSTCIAGINSLVILEEEMTEEFPFPRIVRDIGQSTYQTKSCSIRAGIRPLRSDMRRYKRSTVVVGQLAGYSVVTLVPPRVKQLGGLSLDFHERVVQAQREQVIESFPLLASGFGLSGKTWTREFESELSASGDILLATLTPGDGLLVPKWWFYGVRSINNGFQLHATVTWFLGQNNVPAEDQKEYDRNEYLRRFPPWVTI
jgi:hypothetical protein